MLKTLSPEPCFLFVSVPMHVGRPVLWVEKGPEVAPFAAIQEPGSFHSTACVCQCLFLLQPLAGEEGEYLPGFHETTPRC